MWRWKLLVCHIKIRGSQNDRDTESEPSVKIKYNITLRTPSTSLMANVGLIRLLFAFSGTYTTNNQPKTAFADGLTLEVQAQLLTAMGQTATTSAGTIQVFERPGYKCDVTIDLLQPLVRILDKDNKPAPGFGTAALALKTHVAKLGLNYRLTSLQNTEAGVKTMKVGTGTVTLKPTQFVMTVVAATDAKPGAILIWMAVEA